MGFFEELTGGIIAGFLVFEGELVAFVYTTIFNAVALAAKSLPNTSTSIPIGAYFSIATLIIALAGVIEYFILGATDSGAFTIGFLGGDLFMIVYIGPTLWAQYPSVITGMILAFIIVVIGLIVKVSTN